MLLCRGGDSSPGALDAEILDSFTIEVVDLA